MTNQNKKGSYTFCGKLSLQSYKNGHIVFLLAILFLVSCQNSETQQSENTQETEKITESETTDDWRIEENEEEMPLQQELDMLLDSLDSFRKQAFASENEKLQTTLMLIEEVKTSMSSYDASALENIKKLQETAQTAMYDSVTLGEEAAMLAYDEATANLMKGWSEFIANTAEFNNHARAKLLYNDIQKADQADFRIRNTLYNEFASRFNRLRAEKADEINALGGKYEGLQRIPLFYGGPAS